MDRRLSVLRLAARDGEELEVLLTRVTVHVNALSGDNHLISADYMGVVRKRLEEAYGCPATMIQEAAENIRPRYHQDSVEYVEIHCQEMARKGFSQEYRQEYVPQSRRALEQMVEDMFRSVGAVHASLVLMLLERVEIRSSFCRSAADVPDMERAEETAEEAEREGETDGRMWLKEVKRPLDEGIQKQYTDIEIQCLFANQGRLYGAPNGAMCRIAIGIREEIEAPLLFLNGHTNRCNSYLPTVEECDKGGYEVLQSNLVYFPYHGRIMPLNKDTTGKMATQVVEDWRKSRS